MGDGGVRGPRRTSSAPKRCNVAPVRAQEEKLSSWRSVIEGVVCPVKKGSGGSAGHEALLPSLAIRCQLLSHAKRKAHRGSAGHEACLPSLTMHCQICRCRRRRRRPVKMAMQATTTPTTAPGVCVAGGRPMSRAPEGFATSKGVHDVLEKERKKSSRIPSLVRHVGCWYGFSLNLNFCPSLRQTFFPLGAGGQQRGGTAKCLQQLH